tara:strand:+ start:73 stop:363 length:291 start_codon:yes stop_codon:yes gene_type:complete
MLTLAFTLGLALANPISIYDTSDLTVDAPNFNNAPVFSMNNALQGSRNLFGQPTGDVRSNSKRNEEKLDKILKEFGDPNDEYKFIRFRGHLILIKR